MSWKERKEGETWQYHHMLQKVSGRTRILPWLLPRLTIESYCQGSESQRAPDCSGPRTGAWSRNPEWKMLWNPKLLKRSQSKPQAGLEVKARYLCLQTAAGRGEGATFLVSHMVTLCLPLLYKWSTADCSARDGLSIFAYLATLPFNILAQILFPLEIFPNSFFFAESPSETPTVPCGRICVHLGSMPRSAHPTSRLLRALIFLPVKASSGPSGNVYPEPVQPFWSLL